MEQKIYKSGSSLVVVVPSFFVETAGIQKGDKVRVRVNPDEGKIEYQFFSAKQLILSKNFIKKKRKKKRC